jgi:UDP-N-acetyl-2-amino-2-deoxyglucuronate dehydrogenase
MGTNSPLKFGMIGCGRVAENHLKALTSGQLAAQLVAVTDLDETRAKAKAEKYHVPYYQDYHQMMRQHPEIQVVIIATPTGYHAAHTLDLARYGRHLVVEKPMALRVPDCGAMIRACARHHCRLFVVKQNRFNPAVVAARQALESGRFGKLVMGTVRVRWHRTQQYYEQDHWHGTWALDGGVMSQQASHHLDLLQWFMGPIADMHCRTATRLLDIEVEDTALAMIRFESGALGAFEATVATRPEDLEGSLSLLGENGSVVLGGHAVNRILYWRFAREEPIDVEIHHRHSQDIPNVYGRGHLPYLANVIEAIQQNKPGLVEGPEGKKNVEILTALYESAAQGGKRVKPGCRIRASRLGKSDEAKTGRKPESPVPAG